MPEDDALKVQYAPRLRLPQWVGYLLTVVLMIVVTAALLVLQPYLPLSHFPIWYVAVLFVILYWFGEGPALFAFLLGLFVVHFFFTEPIFRLWPLASTPEEWARFVSYFLGSLVVGIIAVMLRRSKTRTEALAEGLQTSMERFRSLVETTSDWIWEVDAQGVYTYASPRVKDLLGYEPSEVLGKTPLDLMTPEEAERLAPLIKHHFENTEPFVNLQNMNIHKDGRLVLLETSGLPIFDEQGVLCGYRGIDRNITARWRTEEALKESEYRYAAAQRAANIGSWDWYIQTGDLVWSDRIEPMFGFAPGQFGRTYQAFLESVHPDDRQFVIDSVDAAVRGEKDYAIEHRIVWPDGTIRWVSETGEVHQDHDGNPVRMFGIVQDITERKEAELALRDSEERFRSIVETTNEWIWAVSIDGIEIYSNPTIEDILGYRPDEIVSQDVFELIYAEDRPKAQKVFSDAVQNKRGWSDLVIRWRRKDGSYRWLESNAVPMMDDDGEIIGFRGADRDITERKLAEEALYEASQRLLFHVENSPLAAIEFDAELLISRWTKGAEKMFGWNASEVIGKRLDDLRLIYDEDRNKVMGSMVNMREGLVPRIINKNRNYRKDGSIIYCEWYNSALLDSHGKFVSVLSLALDVTEEVSLRAKLENQIRLLQQALVPSEPAVVDGYTSAAIYIPGNIGQDIGGDFYDSFITEEGKIGAVIGDVSGKGIEAASLAATARSTIRAFAYELPSVAQVLSHTNTVLCAQRTDPDKFVTVFAAVIDQITGEIEYAGAGHPPAAVWRVNGSIEFLEVGNPPVGIFDRWVFTSTGGQLNPGDKIVLYTDGILEARHDQEFFDLDGIRRTLDEHGNKNPSEVANELLQAAKLWSGGWIKDDVAVVVVERNA